NRALHRDVLQAQGVRLPGQPAEIADRGARTSFLDSRLGQVEFGNQDEPLVGRPRGYLKGLLVASLSRFQVAPVEETVALEVQVLADKDLVFGFVSQRQSFIQALLGFFASPQQAE